MIQLALFPREAGAPVATIRRRGRPSLSLPGDIKTPPTLPPALETPLGMAMADAPTGVMDFPPPPAGDPVYERLGIVVRDVPRTIRRGLAARSRWAGAR